MATTIAKLAAVLSTDAAGFDAGMNRAGQRIQQLEREEQRANAKRLQMTKQLGSAFGAFGSFGGLAGPLSGMLGPIGLLATGLTAAGAAAVKANQDLAKVNQQFADDKIKALREWGEAMEKATGIRPAGTLGIRTKEEEDRLAQLGRAEVGKEVWDKQDWWAALFAPWINRKTAIAIGEGRQAQIDRIQKDTKQVIETLKQEEEAEKKITDAVQKHREALEQLNLENQKRADQLRDEFRTPLEKMRSALAELDALRSGGFIGDETLTRGIQRAATEYEKSILKMFSAQRTLTEAPAALERGSVAEFSARVQAGLQSKRLEQVAAESLKVEKMTLEEIRKLTSKPTESIKFGVADL